MRRIAGRTAFALAALLAVVLVAATVAEKFCGTLFVSENVYSSPLFVGLWAAMAVAALCHIISSRLRGTALWLHLSFAVVLAGALVTYLTAERGTLYICREAPPASMFVKGDGSLAKFPFGVTLQGCKVDYYEGSDVPRDYIAEICVHLPDSSCELASLSMNKVYDRGGYRFCISDVKQDCVALLVRHDVWGVPLTYAGYLMLLLSVVALFVSRKTMWAALLRRVRGCSLPLPVSGGGAARYFSSAVSLAVLCYVLYVGVRRWVETALFPVADGSGALVFAVWCLLLIAFLFFRKVRFASPVLCALSVVVALLCANASQGYVMPVLRTPLLFFHVASVILSYVLVTLLAVNAFVALCIHWFGHDGGRVERLALFGRVLLYPATMLLAVGIFIGAVWADMSWGRYWGWDPKEVWALVTLLLCSFGFHTRSLPFMNRALAFHVFCVVAFLSVLFTFFGVNYLLGGLHSYA